MFLFLERFGVQKLELLFAAFISVMTITFAKMFFQAEPDYASLAKGTEGTHPETASCPPYSGLGTCRLAMWLHSLGSRVGSRMKGGAVFNVDRTAQSQCWAR